MRYDSLRKLARNEQLVRFARDNPGLSLREIAGAFNISHVRVFQILNAAKQRDG